MGQTWVDPTGAGPEPCSDATGNPTDFNYIFRRSPATIGRELRPFGFINPISLTNQVGNLLLTNKPDCDFDLYPSLQFFHSDPSINPNNFWWEMGHSTFEDGNGDPKEVLSIFHSNFQRGLGNHFGFISSPFTGLEINYLNLSSNEKDFQAQLFIDNAAGPVNGTNGVKIKNTSGSKVNLEVGDNNDSYVGTETGEDFSIRTNDTPVATFFNGGGQSLTGNFSASGTGNFQGNITTPVNVNANRGIFSNRVESGALIAPIDLLVRAGNFGTFNLFGGASNNVNTPAGPLTIDGGTNFATSVQAPVLIQRDGGPIAVGSINPIPGLSATIKGNIAVINDGTINPPSLTDPLDRWVSVGERIPFGTPFGGFRSEGTRVNWGFYSSNFGLLERTDGVTKDGLIQWQDNNTIADPSTITPADAENLSKLVFQFRNGLTPPGPNGNNPNGNPTGLDAMTITANGHVGIGQSEPFARLTVNEDQSGTSKYGIYSFIRNKANLIADPTFDGITFGILSKNETDDTDPENRIAVGIAGVADGENDDATHIGVIGTVANGRKRIAIYGNPFPGTAPATVDPGTYVDPDPPFNTGIGLDEGVLAGYFNGVVAQTGVLTITSDRKFKSDIAPLLNSSERIFKLKPSLYNFRKDKEYAFMGFDRSKPQAGFIAQEMEEVFPELVENITHPAGFNSEGKKLHDELDYKGVNYVGLIPHLVATIQEQNARIEMLEEKLNPKKVEDVKTNTREEKPKMESGYKLDQNIPNPFSVKTVINYETPMTAQEIAIGIFDL